MQLVVNGGAWVLLREDEDNEWAFRVHLGAQKAQRFRAPALELDGLSSSPGSPIISCIILSNKKPISTSFLK